MKFSEDITQNCDLKEDMKRDFEIQYFGTSFSTKNLQIPGLLISQKGQKVKIEGCFGVRYIAQQINAQIKNFKPLQFEIVNAKLKIEGSLAFHNCSKLNSSNAKIPKIEELQSELEEKFGPIKDLRVNVEQSKAVISVQALY